MRHAFYQFANTGWQYCPVPRYRHYWKLFPTVYVFLLVAFVDCTAPIQYQTDEFELSIAGHRIPVTIIAHPSVSENNPKGYIAIDRATGGCVDVVALGNTYRLTSDDYDFDLYDSNAIMACGHVGLLHLTDDGSWNLHLTVPDASSLGQYTLQPSNRASEKKSETIRIVNGDSRPLIIHVMESCLNVGDADFRIPYVLPAEDRWWVLGAAP